MKRISTVFLAALSWFTLSLQVHFFFTATSVETSTFAGRVFHFLTFFTYIATAAATLLLTLSAADQRPGRWWNRPSVLSSLTLYLAIVGIVYAALLQGLYTPQGLRFVADRVAHVALPLAFFVYWVAFVPKGHLRLTDPLWWAVLPVVYGVYVFERGKITGTYPYPFLNAGRIGRAEAILNAVGLLVALIGMGLLIVGIDRLLARRAIKDDGDDSVAGVLSR